MKDPNDLLKHLGNIMQKLDEGKINVEVAKAQAGLVKQSNNLLRYQLDREKFDQKMASEMAQGGE